MLGTHVTGSSTHGVPGDGVVITGEKVWTYAFVPSARAVHTQPEINGVRGYDFHVSTVRHFLSAMPRMLLLRLVVPQIGSGDASRSA